MADLSVFLFGGLRIDIAGKPLSHKLGPQSREILAFMLLNRDRLHPRDRLMTMFWEDRTDREAKRCLSTALWRLQRKLDLASRDGDCGLFTMQGGDVGWNEEVSLWLDVDIFKTAAERLSSHAGAGLSAEQVQAAEYALDLYSGDILEGCFSDWAIAERERLHMVRLSMMQILMRHHAEQRHAEAAISLGQAILAADPLREDVHRELIEILMAGGDRAGAHRQYQRCCELLRTELDVAPLPETTRAYEAMGGASSPEEVGRAPAKESRDEHMQKAMSALRDGLMNLTTFAHELEKLLMRVDRR